MDVTEQVLSRIESLIATGQMIATETKLRNGVSYLLDAPSFVGWRAQAMTLLVDLYGEDRQYTRNFEERTNTNHDFRSLRNGTSILERLAEDVRNGYMQSYRQLIEADLLGGLMGQAEYLLEKSYLVAAAAVAGAALQQGLEELAKRHDLKLNTRENLDSLADKLLQAEVIDGLARRQLSLYAGVRNAADHGKTADLNKENVGNMVGGAVDFLARHGSSP